MKIRQLEYFCAVAQAQSISLAARNIYVAQPSISRQIALLEEELGTKLLYRTNKGIQLTDEGQSLYQQSQELFLNMRRIKDSFATSSRGLSGQISIGALYSNMPLLVQKLKRMRDAYPDVRIFVRLGVPEELLSDLRQRKLHLLLLRRNSMDLSGYAVDTLRGDPLELIVSRALDPAPELDEVPIERLRGVPMCMLPSDDAWGYNGFLVNECRKHDIELNISCLCHDTPMVMQMVQAGFGISYQPRSIAETLNSPDIYAKPIRGFSVKTYPCLVRNNDEPISPCLKRFLSLFDEDRYQEDSNPCAKINSGLPTSPAAPARAGKAEAPTSSPSAEEATPRATSFFE